MHGDVGGPQRGQSRIQAQAGGDVIGNDVGRKIEMEGVGQIGRGVRVALTEAHIPDHYIVGVLHRRQRTAHGDAFARRGLAGDGQIRFVDDEGRQELDGAGHIEHHGAVGGGGIDGVAQAAEAGVIKGDHMIHIAKAAAERAAPGAFRSRKRGEVAVGVNRGDDGVVDQVRLVVRHAEIPLGIEIRQEAVGVNENQFTAQAFLLAARKERRRKRRGVGLRGQVSVAAQVV